MKISDYIRYLSISHFNSGFLSGKPQLYAYITVYYQNECEYVKSFPLKESDISYIGLPIYENIRLYKSF